MIIYKGLSDKRLSPKKRSVAVGVFDGVHRGHEKILKKLLSEARRNLTLSTIVTFDPHPDKILNPGKTGRLILMSLPHRLKFFSDMGVDEVVVVRFNRAFAKITREVFIGKLLSLGMSSLSVGYDFRFGYKGEGDAEYLSTRAKENGFRLSVVSALKEKSSIISSTQIRKKIEAGDLSGARRMLGRPVSVYGTVIRGRGRGRKIGYPTANLNPHHETLPPDGVYAAWGRLGGKTLKGVIHIGRRPTFADTEKSLEVHFLHFHRDIYGKDIELIFAAKIRKTRRFASPQALRKAIEKDARRAAQMLA